MKVLHYHIMSCLTLYYNTLGDIEEGKNLAKTLNEEIRKPVWGISNNYFISGY